MEQVENRPDIETRRMELRGIVHLAGEVVAQYWPMRTFVHHNPLHSLEYVPFEETVRRGKQFLGSNGYLPSHQYRAYLKSGRIRLQDLDAALKPLVRHQEVRIGSRTLTHGDVLRACLTEGLCTPIVESLDAALPDPSYDMVERISAKLSSGLTVPDLRERIDKIVAGDLAALGRWLTLSHWCDDTFGTQVVRQINDQLIRWCEAFLDEDHAAWPMPEREKGLYGAWKALASHEWSHCGIKDSGKKIAQLPDYPEDTLLDSLDALGIPAELRQDYLSLQLTALPGWAGFIKWRGEERDYPWQKAYPAGLVKFLAFGKTTISGMSSNSFQYTGRENDGSGLYYYRARYYSPLLHRNVSQDQFNLASMKILSLSGPDKARGAFFYRQLLNQPKQLNAYSYVQNNPARFIDPYGLVTIVAGGGLSVVGPYGVEAGGGVYFDTGSNSAGYFTSVGAGVGLNVSADAFAGLIWGDLQGVTINSNVVAGPISATFLFDPITGDWVGFTLGPGYPIPLIPQVGISATISATGATCLFNCPPPPPKCLGCRKD